MFKVVQASRLYEQIVQQIEESILKGALKPGDQLPAERELAEQFGVSRTAVREAVNALREKGLVEAYSGRAVHRFEHVLDELADCRVDLRNRLGYFAQPFVREDENFTDRHGARCK